MLQPLAIAKYAGATDFKGSHWNLHYLNDQGKKKIKSIPFDYSQPDDRNQVIVALRKLLTTIAPDLDDPEIEYLGRNPLHPAEHILTYKYY